VGLKLSCGAPSVVFSARCSDEASAAKLKGIVDGVLASAKRPPQSPMPLPPEVIASMEEAVKMLNLIKPVLDEDKVQVTLEGQTAADAIRKPITEFLKGFEQRRSASKFIQSANNMKQIGLCMHNYHDAHKRFPGRAICDKRGKPLLSWRVAILPYLDEGELYKQFHLDEPWDSPHNRKLLEKMPEALRSPVSKAPPNTTTYLVPVGPGTVFERKDGCRLRDIKDGSTNTVMLIEASDDRAVPWTRPDDWRYDPAKPTAGLAKASGDVIRVLFCDGSVRPVMLGLDIKGWKAMLTRAGGEKDSPFGPPQKGSPFGPSKKHPAKKSSSPHPFR
jgi:hypothetical protein